MNGIRLGLQFRGLRVHKNVRQEDVGRVANMSRAVISRIERGLIDNLQIGQLDRAAAALGATIDVRLRWHGEQLDRLLDEGHSAIVERTVSLLRVSGWEVAVEVSFSIWGERGSIDVLAYEPSRRVLLVIEVKSVVPDSQATLHDLDRKSRLASRVAADRGWDPAEVARLLVVGGLSHVSAPGRPARRHVSGGLPDPGPGGHTVVAGTARTDIRPALPVIRTARER